MSDYLLLTEEQVNRIRKVFLRERSIPRFDDCLVLSAVIHIQRNGRRHAP